MTSLNTGLNLIMALSYSSRWELVNAVKNIGLDVKAGKIDPDTINQDTAKITAYKNQTLMKRPFINAILLFQNISGKDAINNPAAGMGTPLKPKLCFISKLNLANL